MLSPFFILVVLALLLAILSMIWPQPYMLAVSVVLLCVAELIKR